MAARGAAAPDAESTLTLLEQARRGDSAAMDRLFARYVPALSRWARGRLPQWARDVADTPDLVQDALLKTFRNLDGFEHRGEGALHAYLRQAVLNRIREELRRKRSRPERETLAAEIDADGPSAYEVAVGRETAARYEAALERLSVQDREAVIAKVELGLGPKELALALDKPSADAARMAAARALVRLAKEMERG